MSKSNETFLCSCQTKQEPWYVYVFVRRHLFGLELVFVCFQELFPNALFIVDGVSRFDLVQSSTLGK